MSKPTKTGSLKEPGPLADKQADVLDHGSLLRTLRREQPSSPVPEDARRGGHPSGRASRAWA